MKRRLTPKTIDALPPSKGKRYEVRDSLLPGLHIRVSRTGSKVWYLATRIDDRARRIKLGAYPVFSPSDARERAQSILRDVALGKYAENGAGAPERSVPSVREAIDAFIDKYAKRNTKDWRGTQRVLLRLTKLHRLPLDQVKRADVVRELERMIEDIETRGGKGIRANRGLAGLKRMFSWCIDQGYIDTNPVAGLKPLIKEIPRDRVLTDDELKGVWKGADAEGYPFGPFVKLMILTGARRGEVAGLRWSEIDFDKCEWTLPARRAKNGNAHIVPLAPLALDILRSLPRVDGCDLIFSTNARSPISGFGRLKERLDEHVGFDAEPWRLHDLRRTFGTGLAELGVQPHVIALAMNHRSGVLAGVTGIYVRHPFLDERRQALELWAERVQELVARETKIPA